MNVEAGFGDRCSRAYSDEDWIDCSLGHKPEEERAGMIEHAKTCAVCAGQAAEWDHLLRPDDGRDEAGHREERPSLAIKQRLVRQVQRQAVTRRIRTAVSRSRRGIASAACAIVLLAGIAGLMQIAHKPADDARSQYVVEHEPGAMLLMRDPQTASVHVLPSRTEWGEGFLWFNDASSEALVLLEGLLPSDNLDVQAWAVDDRGRESLGLLRYDEAARAHLYVHGQSLAKVHNIVLTVEPTGGSERPTTPDAFVFQLPER